jgi:hypothetical protein
MLPELSPDIVVDEHGPDQVGFVRQLDAGNRVPRHDLWRRLRADTQQTAKRRQLAVDRALRCPLATLAALKRLPVFARDNVVEAERGKAVKEVAVPAEA